MMKLKLLLCIFCAFILSACATPYQEASATGGWTIKNIEGDVYRVTFSANGFSTQETTQTYWLYRCATLAMEKGFNGFEILSNINLVQSLPPEQFFGDSNVTENASFIYVPTYQNESRKPLIQADIKLLGGEIKENPPKVFWAAKLRDALEPFVNGKKCSTENVCEHVHRYLFTDEKANTL